MQSGTTHGKSDITRSKETIDINVKGSKSGGEEVQLHTVYYTRLLERSAFLIFIYSPNGMKLKFVVAAFSHNC